MNAGSSCDHVKGAHRFEWMCEIKNCCSAHQQKKTFITNLVFQDFHRVQTWPLRWASGHLWGWTCWTWLRQWPQPSGCACAWVRSALDERAPRRPWACRAFPERPTHSGLRRWSGLWSGCTSVERERWDRRCITQRAWSEPSVPLWRT